MSTLSAIATSVDRFSCAILIYIVWFQQIDLLFKLVSTDWAGVKNTLRWSVTMKMAISIKAGIFPEFKGGVELNALAKKLEAILEPANSEGYGISSDRWTQLLVDLIPEAQGIAGYQVLQNAVVKPEPPELWPTGSKHWVAVSLGNPPQWFFYHQRFAGYELVGIPEECGVTNDGNIWVKAEYGSMLAARPTDDDKHPDPAWPWVLLQPKAWVALREMKKMLVAEDTNPLTILLRSPFLTKGLALQLKRDLDRTINTMTEGLKSL